MNKKIRVGWAMVFVLFPLVSRAHLRNYLDTYGPYTLEKGKAEAEIWTDYRKPKEGDGFWVNQTEVEYGVTNRYSLGLYGVFIEGQGFSAVKVENRYRLNEPGEWPVDTALYLEFKKGIEDKAEDEIEGKVILSKDWGPVNLSANPILEIEKEEKPGGDEWELEAGLALGTCYKNFWKRVTPGIELFLAEKQSRVTPGLYIDLAPDVRLNLGAGIGIEKAADPVQLKTILELEF